MLAPLLEMPPIPTGSHPGAFGVKRKHHYHEGVDLYCPVNTVVYPMDKGRVVWKGQFTGKAVGSPWWNDTEAVAVEHEWGIMFYGEILSNLFLRVGDRINKGYALGRVMNVLKNDKGNGKSMLHLELYSKLPIILPPPLWVEDKPEGLLNPTDLLLELM